jgi:hypothetical protein
MYDREAAGMASSKTTTSSKGGLVYRLQSLAGIVGFRTAKPYPTWKDVLLAPLNLVWRPHLLLILVFEVKQLRSLG